MDSTQLTLTLIEDTDAAAPVWSLDEQTREIGRRRVAQARALLRSHEPTDGDAGGDHHSHPHAA